MMLPYSWFSITITKTCEKDGTTGAGGGCATGAWQLRAAMARCINLPGGSVVFTRRGKRNPATAQMAARAREFARGLDLKEYRRLKDAAPHTWPATPKPEGLDFDRAFL